MRILTIFIDMIRANRLSTFNEKIPRDTPLDISFKQLGGTFYTNIYSPCPDTPRGISIYLTGVESYKNGCTTRLKWPKFFLKQEYKTIFDLFIEQEYKIDIFHRKQSRKTGFFPKHIDKLDIFNKNNSLKEYLQNLKLEEKHFVFIGLDDYHMAFDDLGYSTYGEKKSYKVAKNAFDTIFDNLNKDDFDHIFIFSDHGFKLLADYKAEPKEFLLDDDRTNSILIHRKKYQNDININDKLCSLADFYATYQDVLGQKVENGISFFDKKEREYVVLEDHINFTPQINQNLELWGLVTKDNLYLRTLEKAIMINKKNGKREEVVNSKYDDIIKENSSYFVYSDEYEKIFRYKELINVKDTYSNGDKRYKTSKIYRYYFVIIDTIKKIFYNI